jgi:hypothetical protein
MDALAPRSSCQTGAAASPRLNVYDCMMRLEAISS